MSIAARRDVFQAIADPTRREIIQLVARRSMTLNRIADNFAVSRPAISQHIKILEECGLVEVRQQGRERHCAARLEPLMEVADWVAKYKEFWNTKLDALERFLDESSELNTENPEQE